MEEKPARRYSMVRCKDAEDGADIAVSVIVPVFNAQDTLKQALASIPDAGAYGSVEIVCVEDCSTDKSREIIDECSDPRITRVYHHRNAGYGAAMNDGIEAASGKWIAILEPDDYISGSMFETLLSEDERCRAVGRGCDLVKSPYIRLVRDDGVGKGGPEKPLNCSYRGRIRESSPFDLHFSGKASHLLRHHPSIWSAIYRRDFLEAEGIRFVEYPGAGWADNEFFYKTMLLATSIGYVDEPFYCYREETDGEHDAFVRRTPEIPFDRWHSMQDFIEEIDASPEVRKSHVSRGFTYLAGCMRAMGENDSFVIEQRAKMFDRIAPEFVIGERQLSLHLKELYLAHAGLEADKIRLGAEYLASLVGETVYTMKNNGPAFTAKQIAKFFGR